MKHRDEWNYVVIWEFRIRPEAKQGFEEAYGRHGRWAAFFKQDEQYIGTELTRDLKDPGRYVTLDFWTSHAAYENFRNAHEAEYAAIDRECEPLTESEVHVASLQIVV